MWREAMMMGTCSAALETVNRVLAHPNATFVSVGAIGAIGAKLVLTHPFREWLIRITALRHGTGPGPYLYPPDQATPPGQPDSETSDDDDPETD